MVKVKVGSLTDFPEGKMKGLEIEGKKILVVNVEGDIYATSSVCSHEDGPLEEGELRGHCVTCPWHQASFDVKTGKVIDAPAEQPIQVYSVTVEREEVFVEIE